MLALFTVVEHIAHGMLLPLLLCFPTGTALQATKRGPGASCSTCPSTGCCWGGRGAGAWHQLLLPVCMLVHRAKGERARAAWPSTSGYLCASPFLSFPSSAAEVRDCCCGRERVKGKVRCFGQGGERLALAGVGERGMCRVYLWEGGREGAETDAGMKRGLLLISSWQRNKSRFGPRG